MDESNLGPIPAKYKTPKSPFSISFKTIRIFLLLTAFVAIGLDQWIENRRITDWKETLWLVLYPINGDGSRQSAATIRSLRTNTFKTIEAFMEKEALRYQLGLLHPVRIELAPEVKSLPPDPPSKRSMLNIAAWSLKMRFWALRSDTYEGPRPDIRIFAVYFDPKTHRVLNHSFGLEKGRLARANVSADARQAEQNNVVISHEMLHTLGASDKYNLDSFQPRYPEGYADPSRDPLHPQVKGEIMGGRIPTSAFESHLPKQLIEMVIGEQTSREIRWRD